MMGGVKGRARRRYSQGDQGGVPGEGLLWDDLDAVAMETTKQQNRGISFLFLCAKLTRLTALDTYSSLRWASERTALGNSSRLL